MGLAFNLFILMYHLRTFSDDSRLLSALESCQGYDYFKSRLGVIEIARGVPSTRTWALLSEQLLWFAVLAIFTGNGFLSSVAIQHAVVGLLLCGGAEPRNKDIILICASSGHSPGVECLLSTQQLVGSKSPHNLLLGMGVLDVPLWRAIFAAEWPPM